MSARKGFFERVLKNVAIVLATCLWRSRINKGALGMKAVELQHIRKPRA